MWRNGCTRNRLTQQWLNPVVAGWRGVGGGGGGGGADQVCAINCTLTDVERLDVWPCACVWGGEGGWGGKVCVCCLSVCLSASLCLCLCVYLYCLFVCWLRRHMGSHTPSSEASSRVLEGGRTVIQRTHHGWRQSWQTHAAHDNILMNPRCSRCMVPSPVSHSTGQGGGKCSVSTDDDEDIELDVLGCRVDTLGANCDQCVCTVQCCITSTETVRLIRTGSPGRPPRFSNSSQTLMCFHWWWWSDA